MNQWLACPITACEFIFWADGEGQVFIDPSEGTTFSVKYIPFHSSNWIIDPKAMTWNKKWHKPLPHYLGFIHPKCFCSVSQMVQMPVGCTCILCKKFNLDSVFLILKQSKSYPFYDRCWQALKVRFIVQVSLQSEHTILSTISAQSPQWKWHFLWVEFTNSADTSEK